MLTEFRMAIAAVASLVLALVFSGVPLIAGFFLGVGGSASIALLDKAPSNKYHWKLLWHIVRHPRSRVRVSMSYLFRIRSSGKYLLIRGSRFPDQFQPVGGVYKVLPSGISRLRTELRALDDDLIPIDQGSDNDLRVRVPTNRLLRFLDWFDSGLDRECTPTREFYEELIAPGLLPSAHFEVLDVQFIRRHYEPLRFSDYAKSNELLVADIYELALDGAQEQAIAQAAASNPERLYWATSDQIERHGATPGQAFTRNIALPAQWLL